MNTGSYLILAACLLSLAFGAYAMAGGFAIGALVGPYIARWVNR